MPQPRTWLVLVGVMMCAVSGCQQKQETTTADVQEIVERELPVGTPLARAQEVLSSKGWEHSYIPAERTVRAMLRDTSSNALVKGSIQITLQFDDQKKLASHDVKEMFTGP
jgi:hypothetical protein